MKTWTIETEKRETDWRIPSADQPELASLVNGAMSSAIRTVSDGSTLLYAVRAYTPGYEILDSDGAKKSIDTGIEIYSHYSTVTKEGIEVPAAIMYEGKLMLCNDFDQHLFLLCREVRDESGQPSREMYLKGKANVLALMANRLDHHLPYFMDLPREFQSRDFHEEIVTLQELVRQSGAFRELEIYQRDLDLFYGHKYNPKPITGL